MSTHRGFTTTPASVSVQANAQEQWPCYGQGELFYSERRDEQEEACRLCQGCPVRAQCLELALHLEGQGTRSAKGYSHGVWGGMTADEREPLIAARKPGRSCSSAAGICTAPATAPTTVPATPSRAA